MKYTPEQVRAAREDWVETVSQRRLPLSYSTHRTITALLSGDLEAVKAVLPDGYAVCEIREHIPAHDGDTGYTYYVPVKAAQHNSGGK